MNGSREHRDLDDDDNRASVRFHERNRRRRSKRDWSFSLGSGTLARGAFPAKFNFNIFAPITAANCTSDFVVYGLNVAGVTGGQANLVVLQNLYSGTAPAGLCGANPTVKWAYNVTTVTNGRVVTSPVLSLDGTKVAFVESVGANSVLHVLRFRTAGSEGTVSASVLPATSTSTAATWTACLAGTTSCMFNLTFGTSGTTRSSPYCDYDNDVIYQANDNGQIFKITGVFKGTPALSNAGGWLTGGVTVAGAGTIMTSPVLDPASGQIFLGASNGTAYAVSANAPSTQSSMTVGSGIAVNAGGVIFDGPVVDSTNKTVFFQAASNAANVGNSTANTAAVVVQATTTPVLFGSKTVAVIGLGMAGSASANVKYTHDGNLDQAYYNWTGVGNNLGHYFVCGSSAAVRDSVIYAIPFAAGAAGATISPGAHINNTSTPSGNLIASPATGAANDDCTSVTELYNGTNDRVFVGAGLAGTYTFVAMAVGTGAGGAFQNTDITNVANITTVNEPAAQGGVSGIVVDNISAQGQASSIYFATLATSNNCGAGTFCAVKLTQAGLQ